MRLFIAILVSLHLLIPIGVWAQSIVKTPLSYSLQEYGIVLGTALLGGLLACIWWIAREHTQAEYRWIEQFGHGLRANMPQWGGFDPRIWNVPSVLDWLVPVIACLLIYALMRNK